MKQKLIWVLVILIVALISLIQPYRKLSKKANKTRTSIRQKKMRSEEEFPFLVQLTW